ncbi:hypothetical protein AVEN_146201-1 [Araneus ventricosus]|uniref:Uncharacterized protein n=1 Tax=Araneus ventricosus TaxID=182803 RepID=A0A4Y2CKR5_ARAVE|nr:hypothetical protein AVEN_146201-1 [Araneus ventricosus]
MSSYEWWRKYYGMGDFVMERVWFQLSLRKSNRNAPTNIDILKDQLRKFMSTIAPDGNSKKSLYSLSQSSYCSRIARMSFLSCHNHENSRMNTIDNM